MLGNLFLFVILGLVGAMPLTILVAALKNKGISSAAREINKFLTEWSGLAPEVQPILKKVLGFSGSFVFLFALALVLAGISEGSMPYLTFIPHLPHQATQWRISHADDWSMLVFRYKGTFANEKEYEEKKGILGHPYVLGSRTAFMYALILFVAGLVDVARRQRWRRGVTSLILGAFLSMTFYSLWFKTEGNYVRWVIIDAPKRDNTIQLPESARETFGTNQDLANTSAPSP